MFFVIIVVNFSCAGDAHAQNDTLQQIIQSRMEQLQDSHILDVDGNRIAAVTLLPELYTKRRFTLAWQDGDKRNELIDIIRHIDGEGLNPQDYLLPGLLKFHERFASLTDAERADFDILLTESLVRLGYHLRFGKVDPKSLDANWNLNRSLENEDPAALIQAAVDADSIQAFIDGYLPRQPYYTRYKKALADYRRIEEQGGWPQVPDGPALKPGMSDPRIAILKQRLHKEGYAIESTAAGDLYDNALEDTVKLFQQRHGLQDDGVTGKQTIAALNVSVRERIDQIRLNLERARWVFKDVQGEFFIINIAGFKAYLVRDNKLAWSSRVIIGRTYRKTPVFKSELKYMILNPSWTVPPGILRNDVLPKARKSTDYIREQGFNVLDRNNQRVDPDSIDWSAYSGRNFPYTVRQPPGANNALGRIKFMFPNSHFVYLHDTPHKELFDQAQRTFSSGCIRIEKPLELAELLMNDRENWSQEKISEAIDTGKTQYVYLPKPVTIILMYWTVVIEPDGVVQFRNDIYNRDRKILEALDGKFKLSLPTGLPKQYYH